MSQLKHSQRFEFLDGLRGIAALGVIFFHFNGTLKDHGIFVVPDLINFICELGHYGVQIFFVLSGFVIAYSLRYEKMTSLFCLRFFLKRSIRLDPPYWLIVAFMLMLNFMGDVIFNKGGESLATPFQVLMNLLYLPDFLQIPRILPVAWTLCIEIQFYMSFVFLLSAYQFLMNRFYPNQVIFFDQSLLFHSLFGSLLILSLLQNTSWSLFPFVPGIFIPYWYSFFIGCLACWAMLNLVRPTLLWIYFAIIGYYSAFHSSGDALAVILVTLGIYLVAVKEGMHRLFTSWFFQYAGKISYSLYLIHWPIGMKCMDISIRFFGHKVDNIWLVALLVMASFAMTFLAAHCFYYLIEYPSLKLSQKLKLKFSRSF